MRVSVVATGIEVRPAVGASAEVATSRISPLSMPSFRLRQAPAKAASEPGVPVKAPAEATAASADHGASEAQESPGRRDRASPGDPTARPRHEPAGAGIAKTKERVASEPGYWHPPLPPQERFQEWGKLRAPVREAERPPSLFERVTASFGRGRERVAEPSSPPLGRADGGDARVATVEEDAYDIPAFLRR
jgi:hypothetical protein